MTLEFSMLLSPFVLGTLLAICLLVSLAISAAFLYHWKEYGMNTRIIRRAPAVYLSVLIFLFALAAISYIALISL